MKSNIGSLRVITFFLLALLLCGACDRSRRLPAKMLALGNPNISPQQLRQRGKEVLFTIMAGEDPTLRCNALETLAQYEVDAQIAARIREGLNDPSVAVRFAAAVAAGDIEDYSSKPLLERLLRESNPSLKMAAAYALEKMGDKRFHSWYDAILKSKDPQLCSQACLLIGKLGNTKLRHDSVEKLQQVMRKKDQEPSVKLQAAESLARLGDTEVFKNLLVFANSGYASDRILAISGLQWLIKNQTAQTMLLVLADDEHLEVRLTAIRALDSLADESYLEIVRQNLYYQHPEENRQAEERIRGLALLALGNVGKSSDAYLLYKALAAQSGYYRVAAARATVDFLKRRLRQ